MMRESTPTTPPDKEYFYKKNKNNLYIMLKLRYHQVTKLKKNKTEQFENKPIDPQKKIQ